MTYNKPDNIKYVEMCMYFDNNIYKEDRNDTLLFQYLYHIIYMLACKGHLFPDRDWEMHDKFAIYMATKVYLRYVNPIHQGPEDRIKSVLNYCKTLLYPTKVDFQKETFAEIFGSDPNNDSDLSILKGDLVAGIQASHKDRDVIIHDLSVEFEQISKLIWKEVNSTPYSNDAVLSKRLFMSILISLVKGVTLSNSAKNKIQKRTDKSLNIDTALIDALSKERDTSTTLWRLDDSYSGIVSILTLKVRKACGENVNLVRKEFELSDDDVEAVLASAYGNVLRDDNEEM